MKVIRGIKIGGLQQKIFNLVLIFIVALIAAYAAVSFYQQRNLTNIVQESIEAQQESIAEVSEETMEAVLDTSMSRTTALQAYIADELFSDVRSDVLPKPERLPSQALRSIPIRGSLRWNALRRSIMRASLLPWSARTSSSPPSAIWERL